MPTALIMRLNFDVGALLIGVERSQKAVCRCRMECVSIDEYTDGLLSDCF